MKPREKPQPVILVRLAHAKPTKVFDTYWRFAAERHSILLARLRGAEAPWTADPIIRTYRFTNTFRANDRVSQFLIGSVLGDNRFDWVDTFFRVIVFKIFNRIDTWNLMQSAFGEVSWRAYSFRNYDRLLTSAREKNKAIFSAAYIMPSGGSNEDFPSKHQVFLKLVEQMMANSVPQRIQECRTMEHAFGILRSLPLLTLTP